MLRCDKNSEVVSLKFSLKFKKNNFSKVQVTNNLVKKKIEKGEIEEQPDMYDFNIFEYEQIKIFNNYITTYEKRNIASVATLQIVIGFLRPIKQNRSFFYTNKFTQKNFITDMFDCCLQVFNIVFRFFEVQTMIKYNLPER